MHPQHVMRRIRSAGLGGLLVAGTVTAALALPASIAHAQDSRTLAWGANNSWQLGEGSSTANRLTPSVIAGLTGTRVTSLAAGGNGSGFGLALLANRTVEAWGYNGHGQLGDGSTANRPAPAAVSGLTDVTAIASGGLHNLALLADGTVKAWGYNGYGQLGDGTTANRTTPVTVSGLSGARDATAGVYHSLAVMSDGTARTWGYNANGELGDGTTTTRNAPVAVSGLTDVRKLDTTYRGSVALLGDGTVRAWGYNANGQLGDGTTTNRLTPVQVVGANGDKLTGIIDIAGGREHTIALTGTGLVRAWGYNASGQLGDGTTTQRTAAVTTDTRTNTLTRVAAPVYDNFSYAG